MAKKIDKKKLKEAILMAIDMISNNMLSERMTDVDLIKSFEFIENSLKLRKLDINDIAVFMYESKNEKYEYFDKYFKMIQRIIRKNAEKSMLFDKMIRYLAETTTHPKNGLGITVKQAKQAYSVVLDWYDPNKHQSIKDKMFRWEGFWSLIKTREGVITGVYLSDTMDCEIFYNALSSKAVFKNTGVRKQKKTLQNIFRLFHSK